MTGTAVQRFWECSGLGYQKASHQVCLHAQRCQRIMAKVILMIASLYAFSYSNHVYIYLHDASEWWEESPEKESFQNYKKLCLFV